MFIALLMQFRYIYMASDDFGYATLSYAASTSYDGAKGLFDYLKTIIIAVGGGPFASSLRLCY